jgi:hypothetical protein
VGVWPVGGCGGIVVTVAGRVFAGDVGVGVEAGFEALPQAATETTTTATPRAATRWRGGTMARILPGPTGPEGGRKFS